MKISSCSRTFSWPTYSASDAGRSARSIAFLLHGEAGFAEIRRSVSTLTSDLAESASAPARMPSATLQLRGQAA